MTKHGSPRPSFGAPPPSPNPPSSPNPPPSLYSVTVPGPSPTPSPLASSPNSLLDRSLPIAAARIALARDYAVLEADPGFAALIGVAGDALIGRSLLDFIFPTERQAVADRLGYAIACRNDDIGALALRRPDEQATLIEAALRYDAARGEGLWLYCSPLTPTLTTIAGSAPLDRAQADPPRPATAGGAGRVNNPAAARTPRAERAQTPPTTAYVPADPPREAPGHPDGLDDAIHQVLRLEDVRGEAMLVIGAAGQILAGTSAAATRVGCPVEMLAGTTVDDLFVLSPSARDLLHDAVRTGRRLAVPASIVCGMALAKLEWLPAQRAGYGFLAVQPVHTTAGTDEHAVALQQAVRLMWHDAGEAVTALVLGTETLSQLLGADARRPGAAHIASDLTRHARMIHQALAEVRRAENGTPVELGPVDLNAVIEGYVAAIGPAAAAESIRVTAQLAPDIWVRSTDLRVRSIVRNIVMNARQALQGQPGGGAIEITTTFLEGDDGPGVQLVVRDDGPGMSDALTRVIFEPGLSDRDGGTGIGLNLVRQFIVESGGAVQPLSRPGAGTAFVIWLPTVPSATSPSVPTAPSAPSAPAAEAAEAAPDPLTADSFAPPPPHGGLPS
ncbi:MAG: PAS domain-containing sensor histidine kinase [Ardenticatenales bacterium]